MKYINVIVACAFLSAGIVNLIGPTIIRAEFAKWGYPNWFRLTIAMVELVGSLLLFMTKTQSIGAAVLLAVTLGVLVTFVRSKEWMKTQYPLVLFFLLIVALSQTYLSG